LKLYKQVERWKKKGLSIVFTNGCFDILHYGHLSLLYKARCLGHRVVVGLNSDKSVRKLKGAGRPIINEVDRKKSLEILSFVDCVLIFDDETPINLIKSIRPNILVKGGDYKLKDIVGIEYVDETIVFPFQDGYSTTNIINSIRSTNYE